MERRGDIYRKRKTRTRNRRSRFARGNRAPLLTRRSLQTRRCDVQGARFGITREAGVSVGSADPRQYSVRGGRLFVTQRLNRIETGCAIRWVESEADADSGADKKAGNGPAVGE